MKYSLLLLSFLWLGKLFGQSPGTFNAFKNGRSSKMDDSAWYQTGVQEKINYCLHMAENYMQLCGRSTSSDGRNTQKYIYTNTRQLHNFGEYTYSKRQRDFFDQNADSIAFYFRKSLLQDSAGLFYWHNILLNMETNWQIAQVLLDYYELDASHQSEALSALIQMMETDSMEDYMGSAYYKRFDKQNTYEAKIPNNVENRLAIYRLAEDFQWVLYRSDWKRTRVWDSEDFEIRQRLEKADTFYKKTGKVSNENLSRLSARELLTYCRYKPEQYAQICALIPDGRDNQKYLYVTKSFGSVSDASFSERQKKAIDLKRDSCAALLADYINKDPYDEKRYDEVLIDLCNAWETVPYLVLAEKMYGFHSRSYIRLLRGLMAEYDYQPYRDFMDKVTQDEKQAGSWGVILNTKENRQKILELAESFYRSKARL